MVGADGTTFQLDLVIKPSSAGADLADAVADFEAADVVAVLGPENSADVLNGLGSLEQLNVPILTPASGDTVLAVRLVGAAVPVARCRCGARSRRSPII